MQAVRRISVFGHIARLEGDVPALMALRRHIDLSVGRPDWRRDDALVDPALDGDEIGRDSSSSPVELWRSAIAVAMLLERCSDPRRLRDTDDDEYNMNKKLICRREIARCLCELIPQ